MARLNVKTYNIPENLHADKITITIEDNHNGYGKIVINCLQQVWKTSVRDKRGLKRSIADVVSLSGSAEFVHMLDSNLKIFVEPGVISSEMRYLLHLMGVVKFFLYNIKDYNETI